MPKTRKEDIGQCCNPEFAQWLCDWHREAQEADSRMQFALRKALDSVLQCSERLKDGREAARLRGIGPGISERLQKRLRKHISEGNPWHCALDGSQAQATAARALPRARRPLRQYIPKFRSVAYAIVMCLYLNKGRCLTKNELLGSLQEFCNKTVTRDSMKTNLTVLLSKELVCHNIGMSSFSLTEIGKDVGMRLWSSSGRALVVALSDSSDEGECNPPDNFQFSIESWRTDQFSLVLLIDTREVHSRSERDDLLKALEEANLPVLQSVLALGDFIFVARNGVTGEEVMLDTIIERKADADMVASIPDGRYREQKHRLCHCGIKNRIYLLEGSGEGSCIANFGEERYFSAISQTLFSDGLFVKRCSSASETVQFLADTYDDLKQAYEGGLLVFRATGSGGDPSTIMTTFRQSQELHDNLCIPLDIFTQACSKNSNQTYFDVFVQQLMTIRGITAEAALRMANEFGGYRSLLDCLQSGNGGAFAGDVNKIVRFIL